MNWAACPEKTDETFISVIGWQDMTCETYNLPVDELMPNNQDLAVVVYRDVAPGAADLATLLEETFAANGWGGMWRNGIYDYHHYHPNAHEVLGIARGQVTVRLGGPTGILFDLVAGDCVILPAGTGHCRIDASPDLLVIGAYPPGQENPAIERSWQDKVGVQEVIRAVPVPETNPLKGLVSDAETLWVDRNADFLDIAESSVSYTPLQSGFGTGPINQER